MTSDQPAAGGTTAPSLSAAGAPAAGRAAAAVANEGNGAADGATLGDVSSLIARPFATREEAAGAVLDLIQRATGMSTAFVSRTNRGLFEVEDVAGGGPVDASGALAAAEAAGTCLLPDGTTLPLEDSY